MGAEVSHSETIYYITFFFTHQNISNIMWRRRRRRRRIPNQEEEENDRRRRRRRILKKKEEEKGNLNLPRLEIRNIKVSLILADDFQNTGIFRLNNTGAILTIYHTSKRLINVTNIKDLEHLYQLKRDIQEMYDVKIEQTRIDSVMLSRKVKGDRRFSEKKYLPIFNQPKYSKVYKMDYNPESFHAPTFRSIKKGGGFFNIFSNGSCTVMGVKDVEYIMLIEEMLDKAFCKKHEIIKE